MRCDVFFAAPGLKDNAEALAFCRSLAAESEMAVGSYALRLNSVELTEGHEAFFAAAQARGLDAGILPEGADTSRFKTLFCALDCLVIEVEFWAHLLASTGSGVEYARIAAAYRAGRIAEDNFCRRCAFLLKRFPENTPETAAKLLPVTHIAKTLFDEARSAGLSRWIVANAPESAVRVFARELNADGVFANRLESYNGRLSGRIAGPESGTLLDATGRSAFAQAETVDAGGWPAQSICVARLPSDAGLLQHAGLSVVLGPGIALPADVRLMHMPPSVVIEVLRASKEPVD